MFLGIMSVSDGKFLLDLPRTTPAAVSKTLYTNGKFCDKDILVNVYVSGGSSTSPGFTTNSTFSITNNSNQLYIPQNYGTVTISNNTNGKVSINNGGKLSVSSNSKVRAAIKTSSTQWTGGYQFYTDNNSLYITTDSTYHSTIVATAYSGSTAKTYTIYYRGTEQF